MNIKQLQYFLKTCEYKSISRAANDFYISQPNLSYSLKTLEEELDLKLLIRTKKGVEITKEGKRVLEDSQKILDIIDSWSSLKATGKDRQTITLMGEGFLVDSLFPSVMKTYRTTHEDTTLLIKETTSPNITSKIFDEADGPIICFSFCRPAYIESLMQNAAQNGWKVQLLKSGESMLLVGENSQLAQKENITISDLSKEYFLAVNTLKLDESLYSHDDFFSLFKNGHVISTPNRESSFKLVSVSEDVVTVASFLAAIHSEYVQSGKIKALSITDYPMHSTFLAIYPQLPKYQPMVKEIIDITTSLLE